LVAATDSTFLFGHLPDGLPDDFDDYVITVNDGLRFPVREDGGWLAFVPVTPGEFPFVVRAYRRRDDSTTVASGGITVRVPEPRKQGTLDSLEILGDYDSPAGDLWLSAGEDLIVSFSGSPGQEAWFSIKGVADSVPMAETAPRQQPYWGEAVFGAGKVPDSLLIRGVYTGYLKVPLEARADSVRIDYHLALSHRTFEFILDFARHWLGREELDSIWTALRPQVSKQSGYRVTFNDPAFPHTVQFMDSVQIIRHGPRRGYFSTFQPSGVEALAVGRKADWYKLKLSATQYAWAAIESVTELPAGIRPQGSLLRVVRTYNLPDKVRIEFPLTGKHAYQVVEPDRRTLVVRLYGVTSDTDWIRYDFPDSLVDFAAWMQPEPGLYEFTVHLEKDLWGYDAYYERNSFRVELQKPPPGLPSVKGLRIVIDPGHSSDPGAVGPTGLTEAEANLAIARELRSLFRRRGADVIMTREDTSHVDLYGRPAIAVGQDADLFISIHNNALPDGVNPFVNHGSSTYYYRPHSIDLAKAIQRRLVPATGVGSYGLYHGNLAVARPTQYPAVLVECAFMMIPEQESMLRKDRRFRFKVARAIADGINDFLREYSDDNR
jgi:N-acetylmuramoyl-L-alanine amidase